MLTFNKDRQFLILPTDERRFAGRSKDRKTVSGAMHLYDSLFRLMLKSDMQKGMVADSVLTTSYEELAESIGKSRDVLRKRLMFLEKRGDINVDRGQGQLRIRMKDFRDICMHTITNRWRAVTCG